MGGKIFGQIFTPHFIDTVKKRNSRYCSNSDAGMSTNTQLDMTKVQIWLEGRSAINVLNLSSIEILPFKLISFLSDH